MRVQRKIFSIVCLALPFGSTALAETALYVSPSGNDAQAGIEAKPFRSLEQAQAAVRAMNKKMSDDIVVYLRGGRHEHRLVVG